MRKTEVKTGAAAKTCVGCQYQRDKARADALAAAQAHGALSQGLRDEVVREREIGLKIGAHLERERESVRMMREHNNQLGKQVEDLTLTNGKLYEKLNASAQALEHTESKLQQEADARIKLEQRSWQGRELKDRQEHRIQELESALERALQDVRALGNVIASTGRSAEVLHPKEG